MSSVNKMVKMPPTSETAEMSPVNNIVDITLQDRIIQKSRSAYKEQQKGDTSSILW